MRSSGLDYIDEIGVPAFAVTAELTEDLVARAREYGFRPKVAPARRIVAIVMLPAADPAAGVRHLAAGGIIADARPERPSLSFSIMCRTTCSALERLATHTDH